MITLQETITVARNAQDCYRYLSDFSTIEQWDPSVFRATKLTPGRADAGSEFELILKMAGQSIAMHYRLKSCIPDQRLILRGSGGQISALDTIDIEPISAQETSITYRAELEFLGPQRHFEALLKPWLKRIGRKTVIGLRQALTPDSAITVHSIQPSLAHRLLLPAALDFTQRGYMKMPNKGLSEYIDGKTVVLTGASSGLGLAAACELARLGARLVLIGRDAQKMDAAVQKIVDFSGTQPQKMKVHLADLSLIAETQGVAARIRAEEKHIDVLINNAGALFDQHQRTAEGHERALAINYLSPVTLTQHLLPVLRDGQVINVLSGGLYLQGLKPDDLQYTQTDYNGSKAYARAKRALLSHSEQLAAQIAEHGVRVNCMHPGWADTPGVRSSLPEFQKVLGSRLRDSRMGADTMVWLATSQAAAQANGQFWFDRKLQPTAVLPKTAHTPAQTEALENWLSRQHVAIDQRPG